MTAALPDLPLGIRRLIIAAGFIDGAELLLSILNWDSPDLFKFVGFLILSLAASRVKPVVPGLRAPMPLTFLAIVVAWPPENDKSLLMKTVNWAADPGNTLPTLPPQPATPGT